MIIISVSMVTTIYCLKLHHTVGREAQAMPPYVRYVLLDLLPIVLFLHPPPDPPSEDSESLLKEEERIWPLAFFDLRSLTSGHWRAFEWILDKEARFAPNSELAHIYKELKFISDRMRDEDSSGSYEDEWKYAALVLDRFELHWSLDLNWPFVLELVLGSS